MDHSNCHIDAPLHAAGEVLNRFVATVIQPDKVEHIFGTLGARHRPALEIYDRVGGGDSFASGLI